MEVLYLSELKENFMNFKFIIAFVLIILSFGAIGQEYATVRILEGSVFYPQIVIVRGSNKIEIIELEAQKKPKDFAEIAEKNFVKINSMLQKMEREGYDLMTSSTSQSGAEILTTMMFRKD